MEHRSIHHCRVDHTGINHMIAEAFMYLWYHGPTKRYYLGYHKGTPDDGYSHSSTVMERWDGNNPPTGWRRRILAYGSTKEMNDKEFELLRSRATRGWFNDRYINKSAFPYFEMTPEQRSESAKKGSAKVPREKKMDNGRKGYAAGLGRLTSEERSEIAKRNRILYENRTTAEERSQMAKRARAKQLLGQTAEQRKEISNKALSEKYENSTPEQRKEWAKAANDARMSKYTAEERSEIARKAYAISLGNLTPEERSKNAKIASLAAYDKRTPEQRSQAARNASIARWKKQKDDMTPPLVDLAVETNE
jgi:hypothetical protein